MGNCLNIKRVVYITQPITYKSVKVLDSNGLDITNSCMFSWSIDNVCWTAFTTLENYYSICSNITGDYYLKILIVGNFRSVILDNSIVTCFETYMDNSSRFEIQSCDDNEFNFFNNIDCALLLQQQLSEKIACLFGLNIYYFRVEPDKATKDLTFKEYKLHNISDVKFMKLILQDGQMPSSKPAFTDFDFDWEVDWEVELPKVMFARAFGETAFPKQRDFIYIPMMKRMYEVNSAYDEKEGMLMWQSTTWKLGLVKWNEKTNVDYTGFEDLIDTWVVNKYEDVFGEEKEEQEVESGIVQQRLPKFICDNMVNVCLSDAVRHSISENNIEQKEINHKSIGVARNFYSFRKEGAVKYQKQICGDNGTISMILNTKMNTIFEEKNILEFGEIILKLLYKDKTLYLSDTQGLKVKLDLNNIYIINYRWNRGNFTTDFSVWRHGLQSRFLNVPTYKQRADMFEITHLESIVGNYNNDYAMYSPMECYIYPICGMSNIKYYDIYLSDEEINKEMLKYSTKNEHCVINDNVIPFESGFGSPSK